MRNYVKKPEGVFYHPSYGRVMAHKGSTMTIFWNKDMIDLLKRYYPNTKNEEVAELLGVSVSTMLRKARKLGLYKDKDFCRLMSQENGKIGACMNRICGKKGLKLNE